MEKDIDESCTFYPKFVANNSKYYVSDDLPFIKRNEIWSELKYNKLIK